MTWRIVDESGAALHAARAASPSSGCSSSRRSARACRLPSRRRVEAAEPDDGARRDQRARRATRPSTCARRSTPRTPRCASSTSCSRRTARSRRRRSAARIALAELVARRPSAPACRIARRAAGEGRPRRGAVDASTRCRCCSISRRARAHLGRAVDVAARARRRARSRSTLAGRRTPAKLPANAGDVLALAAFVVAREARRRCAARPDGFVVTLPRRSRRPARRCRCRAMRVRSAASS